MNSIYPSKSQTNPDTTRAASLRPAADHCRRWMHEALCRIRPESAVLALGCDQAFLAAQLAEYANDVTVLDSSTVQIAQLAPRFPEVSFLHHAPKAPLPFPRETFDVVWCCDYLDRVFDPATALREIHRVLKPGGRVLLAVPDQGRARQVILALFRREPPFVPANPRVGHFTRRTLGQLARATGLSDIRVIRSGATRNATASPGRSLLLQAKKNPAVRATRSATDRRAAELAAGALEELALAPRLRSAG